ncbi:MAG: hypothetical protein KC503_10990 [Myxococcales bacterium]|nr:hypothetical protein [Myxococcales bacterium]
MGRHDEPELLASLLQAPDDAQRWQVYGDLLVERGDPRGRAIAIERSGRDDEQACALLAEAYAEVAASAGLADAEQRGWTLGWKNGFVERARFFSERQSAWWQSHDATGEQRALEDVLLNPATQLVRRLEVQFADFDESADVAAAALASQLRPRLETLQLGLTEQALAGQQVAGDPSLGYVIGDGTAVKLREATPALRELALVGTSLLSAAFSHDRVEHFCAATPAIAALHCTWFDGGAREVPFANLHTLSLAFVDDSGHGEDFPVSMVCAIPPRFFPSVRTLDLTRSSLWDEERDGGMLGAIAGLELLPQLDVLATRFWHLAIADADGAPYDDEMLASASDAFAHLSKLLVCEPTIDDRLDALRAAMRPPVQVIERPAFVAFPAFEQQPLEAHRLDWRERRFEARRSSASDD